MKKKREKKNKKFSLQAHQRKLTIVFGLFCLVIIPVYSILLGSRGDWFLHSLSAVGGELGYFGDLVFWGVLIGTFYLFFMAYMFTLVKFENRRVKIFFSVGCITLCLAVFIPFAPKVIPVLSRIHEILSMGATLLIIVAIYFFVLSIGYKDRKIFSRAIIALNAITLVSVGIYFVVGVSSLIEVFVVVALSIFLFALSIALRKSKHINADENYKEAYVQRLKKKEQQLLLRRQEIGSEGRESDEPGNPATEPAEGAAAAMNEAVATTEALPASHNPETPGAEDPIPGERDREEAGFTESQPDGQPEQATDESQSPSPAQQPAEEKADQGSAPARSKGTARYHISLREDGKWQVRREKANKALKLFDTQAEALAYAKTVAGNQETGIVVHRRNGRIRRNQYKSK